MTFDCSCPTAHIATSSMPVPTGYQVIDWMSYGMSPDGQWLYGALARSDLAGDIPPHKIVRWPWPALNSVEEIATSARATAAGVAVMGGYVWWLCRGDGSHQFYWSNEVLMRAPVGGGPAEHVTNLPISDDGMYWGLFPQNGKLWCASHQVTGSTAVSGLYEIGVDGSWAFHQYSSVPLHSGLPMLDRDQPVITVASDGAVWATVFHPDPGPWGRLARFDGSWQTTTVDSWLDMVAPARDGAVRSWDRDLGHGVLVGPDMSITTDPCDPPLLDTFGSNVMCATHGVQAYLAGGVWQVTECGPCMSVATGWRVGRIGFAPTTPTAGTVTATTGDLFSQGSGDVTPVELLGRTWVLDTTTGDISAPGYGGAVADLTAGTYTITVTGVTTSVGGEVYLATGNPTSNDYVDGTTGGALTTAGGTLSFWGVAPSPESGWYVDVGHAVTITKTG